MRSNQHWRMRIKVVFLGTAWLALIIDAIAALLFHVSVSTWELAVLFYFAQMVVWRDFKEARKAHAFWHFIIRGPNLRTPRR